MCYVDNNAKMTLTLCNNDWEKFDFSDGSKTFLRNKPGSSKTDGVVVDRYDDLFSSDDDMEEGRDIQMGKKSNSNE